MTRRSIVLVACLSACIAVAGVVVSAQRRVFDRVFGRERASVDARNVEYDGRLTFVRIRTSGFGGFGRRGFRDPGWAHDYPTADLNIMQIVKELTLADARVDGSNIFTLDDPELFRYPIAYVSEPGEWSVRDEEAEGLRNYLLKGGFIIFDDFRENDWYNLEDQMRRVLPEHRFVQLDISHPIFHSFFEIDSLSYMPPVYGTTPTYFGIFEDNDPRNRLMAIANRGGDLGEYWEFSGTGYMPVDLSNEAYKFGVNYFIYGMTR